MELKFNPYKDIVNVVGNNGSGKTTLVETLFVKNTPLDNIYVLNSSGEDSWKRCGIPKENIVVPEMFSREYFESVLLMFAGKETKGSLLILDDVDNYGPKGSMIFKSVVINARHLNLGVIVTTRDLQSLPINFYQQAHYTFFARQPSDYSLRYIATLIPPEHTYNLKNLDKYVFGVWDMAEFKMDYIKLKGY